MRHIKFNIESQVNIWRKIVLLMYRAKLNVVVKRFQWKFKRSWESVLRTLNVNLTDCVCSAVI